MGIDAIDTEIIGIHGAEQRIVRVPVARAPRLQELKSCLGARRRQLKVVGRHVTVGAGPAVARQALQAAIEKADQAPDHRDALLSATLIGRGSV